MVNDGEFKSNIVGCCLDFTVISANLSVYLNYVM